MKWMPWTGQKKNGKSGLADSENPTAKKFVTKEYHEGQVAYMHGLGMTTNPYLSNSTENMGGFWYWMAGWQDAMQEHIAHIHNDVEGIKGMIAMALDSSHRDGHPNKKKLN